MSTEETSDFNNFVASFAEDAANKVYRNGYAVFLYSKGTSKKEGMKYAASVLDECFMQEDSSYVSNKLAIYASMKTLESKLLNLKKLLKVNWNNNKIQNFLWQPLKPPITKKRNLLSSLTSSSVDITSPKAQDECYIPHLSQQLSDGLPHVREKQLKTDCEKCSKRRKFYMMAISELKVKLRSSRKTLREMSKNYNVRVVNQNMKRKDAAKNKLKRERKVLKIENLNLKIEVNRLKTITGKENVAIAIIDKQEKNKTEDHLSQTNLDIKIIKKKILTKNKIQELELEVNILKHELIKLQEQCSIEKLETILGNPNPLGPKFKRMWSKQSKSHEQKCDGSPLDTASCSEKDIKNITDIPANVAIEIEKHTLYHSIGQWVFRTWVSQGQRPTNPSDIFTTSKIDSSKVSFKSVNGKHWSLQTDGRVVSIAETVGSRELFEPVFKEGKMALSVHNNCFLSYNEDGDIVCESCTADPKNVVQTKIKCCYNERSSGG